MYPEILLPKEQYRIIPMDRITDSMVLCRVSLKAFDEILDDTGHVKYEAIIRSSKEIPELSSILLGIFKTEHIKFKPTGVYNDYWNPGDPIPLCESIEYEEVAKIGLYLLIGDINNKDFDATRKDSSGDQTFQYRYRIVHKPTPVNFWHLEGEVRKQDGGILKGSESKDWESKAMKFFIKDRITAFFSIAEPEDYSCIEDCYYIEN